MFDNLSEKFSRALQNIQGKGTISEKNIEDALQNVRTALLEADVNFKVVKNFIAGVKKDALGEKVLTGIKPGEQFIKIVQEHLTRIMGGKEQEIDLSSPGILAVLIVGLNGQGKTTFSGKFAHYLKTKKKKNVLLVPADTFRPAAKDQLTTLARNIDIPWFDSDLTQSPSTIVEKALEQAKKTHKEVVLIDTAGRLHVDDDLMEELAQVRRSLGAVKTEVLLVADAMTGQEAVNVAKSFHSTLELTGVVLSKMDSDARGGAALSIVQSTGVPIRYISTGEYTKDLELFHPDRLAGRILDMGDIVSLVEKAEEEIDHKSQEQMMKNLEKGRFSVEDFMKQIDMIKNIGSLGGVLKMIPGAGTMLRKVGDLTPAENEIARMRVMINSMTLQERRNHKIINDSRTKRIATGSGHGVATVNKLLSQFQQMEQMMSAFKGGGGLQNMMAMAQGGKKNKSKGKGKGKRGPWGRGYF